jgi:Leucine-rich repeat (LRR) protein
LALGHNEITDISPLAGLPSLQMLWLNGNEISSIDDLPASGPSAPAETLGWSKTVPSCDYPHIDLSDNQLQDLSALVGMSWLGAGWYIDLSDNLLDLSEGSLVSQAIEALRARGVFVCF